MNGVIFEKQGHVGILTVNRPAQLNALSRSLLEDISAAVSAVGGDGDIRCLVITGAGEKAFVAGADIAEMAGFDEDAARRYGAFGSGVMNGIAALGIPTVAAVNGYALGGGCELALSCDMRFAADSAVFGFPETSLGITPGFGGTVRLPLAVGEARAKQLIFTGKKIDAATAESWGLVNGVFPKDELMQRVLEIAHRAAANAPKAVRAAKRNIDGSRELRWALECETAEFARCFSSEDRKNAMNAFLNKTAAAPFEDK